MIDEIDNCSASLVQKCAYKIRMNNLVSQLGRKNTFRRQRNDSRIDLTVNQLRAMSSSYAIKKVYLCIWKSVFLLAELSLVLADSAQNWSLNVMRGITNVG